MCLIFFNPKYYFRIHNNKITMKYRSSFLLFSCVLGILLTIDNITALIILNPP